MLSNSRSPWFITLDEKSWSVPIPCYTYLHPSVENETQLQTQGNKGFAHCKSTQYFCFLQPPVLICLTTFSIFLSIILRSFAGKEQQQQQQQLQQPALFLCQASNGFFPSMFFKKIVWHNLTRIYRLSVNNQIDRWDLSTTHGERDCLQSRGVLS